MDIMQIITQSLSGKIQQLGGNTSPDLIQSVIGSLLGGDSSGIDIGGLISKFQGGGLANLASSWLGDGANEAISATQLEDVLGADKIQSAASQLGVNPSGLLEGLQDTIPQLIDKASSGGELLDAVGGLGGLASMAGKFFK